MSNANLRSIDALAEFRGALIEFQANVRQALDMLDVEARKGVEWLVVDRAQYWKKENRGAWDGLAQAKDALRQARIQRKVADDRDPDCIEEKKAIIRAERRLQTSEDKLKVIKQRTHDVQHAWNEFQARFSQTASTLDGDMPRTVAVLEKIMQRVEEYLLTRAPTMQKPLAADDNTQSNSMANQPSTELIDEIIQPAQTDAPEVYHKIQPVERLEDLIE